MPRFIPRLIDTKFENILTQERSLAKRVATVVIPSPPLTVWEITVPPLFFINFFRLKRARETMALNFLFTKKLALEAAFNIVDKEKNIGEVKEQLKEKTGNILAADKKGIYSAKIRQKQIQEMEFLIEHYLRLFAAEGKDYAAMLKKAYLQREAYLAFLERLEKLEKEVYLAAMQTVKSTSAKEVAKQMEEATYKIRRIDADKIFPPNEFSQDQ
ncbi:MAG: NF038143 family protein [Thermodesulfobacteriota bacterium]